MIRKATRNDAKEIAEIYNYYVVNSIATFAQESISETEMLLNIENAILWYVYVEEYAILGYAYASKWKQRSAYKFTVESSVYLKPNTFNKGIGTQLYTKLFQNLKSLKIHAIIGGMSLPNKASQALHEKFGFKKVAHFKEVGYKFNKWIDVGYWELLLS